MKESICTQLWQQLQRWLAPALELQLFITLSSLPILTWWGMPISCMTIVGNLLFAPALTIFLLLSAIICTATLLDIPCAWVATALNWWHSAWVMVLQNGSQSWLVYTPQHLMLPLIIIAALGFLVLHARALYQGQRIGIMGILLISAWLSSSYLQPVNLERFTIPCSSGVVHVTMLEGQITVLDSGALARLYDAKKWIRYQLAPELTKRCGTVHIARISEPVSNCRSYKALGQLCAMLPVDHIYIAAPTGKKRNTKLEMYGACLQRIAEARGTKIHIKL